MTAREPAPRGRWTLSGAELARIVLVSVILGLAYVLFHELGSEIGAFDKRRSTLTWMVKRWETGRPSYGTLFYIMGWCIPFISLGLVWRQRRRLALAAKRVTWSGLAFVVLALAGHWVAVKTEQHRLSLLALIGLLWSVPLYFYGWAVGRILLFPAAYLVFCLPLNFLDGPMFQVRILAARLSTALLNGLGIECFSRGTTIESVQEGGFVLNLPPADLGLGAFLMFMALLALIANLAPLSLLRRWLLFLLALPLYGVGLVFTTVVFGLLGQAVDPSWAQPRPGLLTSCVVLVSILAVVGVYIQLRRPWRSVLRRWLGEWRRRQQELPDRTFDGRGRGA